MWPSVLRWAKGQEGTGSKYMRCFGRVPGSYIDSLLFLSYDPMSWFFKDVFICLRYSTIEIHFDHFGQLYRFRDNLAELCAV